MKILHYINNMGSGGAEKLLTDILPLMKLKGHEVHLAYSCGGKNVPKFQSLIESYQIPIFDFKVSTYNPAQIFKLIRLIRKQKYDIVHAHLFPTQYWLAFASLFKPRNTKLFKTEHSVYNERKQYNILKPLERFIYGRYYAVIGITAQVTENLANWLGKQSNIYTIENGVNIQQIQEECLVVNTNDYRFLNPSDFNILMVGRFDEGNQKDQTTLIRALAFLPPDCKLVLAGEGEKFERVKQIARDLDVQNRVFFLGMRTDVYKLMSLVDLNVLSTNHEGLSGVALESMAVRKPFIGTDVVGVNNIVPDSQFLFPRQSPESLANKILKVKDHESFRNELVEKAKIHIGQYDIKLMVERYLELYNRSYE